MRKEKCDCERGGSFPLHGAGFSRRQFLQIAGTGLIASYFTDVANARLLHDVASVDAAVQKTARNCILIFLSGAPSHVDTWDLKEGAWTPITFEPTSYGDLRWPRGLMPKTAEHLGKLAIVRSALSWAAVHGLAQTWAQISRNPGGATGRIAPHIGAVVALETQQQRQESDVLPGFVSINQVVAGSGYLPAQYAPFGVAPSATGLAALTHPDGTVRLNERWALSQSLDPERRDGTLGRNSMDMASFYDQAKRLIDTPDINRVFTFNTEERSRYGSTGFGDSLIVARNLIASRRGTRFVQVTMGGWDHHSNIYAANNSLISQMRTFDPAFAALLGDLATTPGVDPAKSLLDETMVLVLGEFGRTTGALNQQQGRDHFLRMSVVFAGGGVRGGRIIGKTNDLGSAAVDYGWSGKRDVRPEDVTSTIYSALGIDYTTIRRDDPLGRGFEYVPFAKDGLYSPINELF
ncbi:MAG TPA: DUF1501 domain-containing protein [Thermoanaerobaculia bacterium]|nr:DUF1501 domain-containing protein [Thermoanaerobaculia bacterium]